MKSILSLVPLLAILATACSDDPIGPDNPIDPVASVAIAPGVRELTVGGTLGLTATVKSAAGKTLNRTIAWTTANPSIATVSQAGMVTGVGDGTVEITATVDGKSDVAAIVVSQAGAGQVATVTLNYTNVDLEEGHAFTFVPTAKDALGNVVTGWVAQWTSSAPDVASVNPIGVGRAMPTKPGIARITVKIHGQTATAEVEVYAAYPYELVYEMAGTTGISLFQLDINDPAALPSPFALPGPISGGRVSPDGTRIAAVVPAAGGHSTIWITDRNGANARPITAGPGLHDQPTWSPDGTRIAYRRWHWQGGEGSDIWSVNVVGQPAPVNLTAETPTSESEPAWSREIAGGSRIAYVRTEQAQGSIWKMRPDGTEKIQLTSGGFDAEPAWSPTGDLIVFQRSGGAIFGDLYLTDPVGGVDPWVLVNLPQIQRAPTWSPDGKLIAFASGHEGTPEQIFTIAPQGNRLARRTAGPGTHSRPEWVAK